LRIADGRLLAGRHRPTQGDRWSTASTASPSRTSRVAHRPGRAVRGSRRATDGVREHVGRPCRQTRIPRYRSCRYLCPPTRRCHYRLLRHAPDAPFGADWAGL